MKKDDPAIVTICGLVKLVPPERTKPAMSADTVVVPAASGSSDSVPLLVALPAGIVAVTVAPACAPNFNCATLPLPTLTVTLSPPPPLRASHVRNSTVGLLDCPRPTHTLNGSSADVAVRLALIALIPTTGCTTFTVRGALVVSPAALAVSVALCPACPSIPAMQIDAKKLLAGIVTCTLPVPAVVVSDGLTSTAPALLLVIVTVVAADTFAVCPVLGL